MIRSVKREDAARIAEIYGWYVENTTVSYELSAPDCAEMLRRIEETTKAYPWLVYEEEGKVIGYAYANKFAEREAYLPSAEIAAYLDREKLGAGRGLVLVQALLKDLLEYGCHTAVALVSHDNEASAGLCLRLGLEHAGRLCNIGRKFGRWLSLDYYTLPLKAYTDE